MKEIKNKARKFKRIYKVKGTPTSYDLMKILKKLGFTTYGYAENEDMLYKTNTFKLSKKKPAFTYIRGTEKYVFYDDFLNEIDMERVLAHEIAHIYCNHFHLTDIVFDTDVNKEWEANLFAVYLLKGIDYKAFLVKGLISLLLVIVIFFCGNLSAEQQTHAKVNDMVYITPTGYHYHATNCLYGESYKNSFQVERSIAEKYYLPCDLCNPEKN